MYWLLVGLVRSLKSSHKEALRKFLLCEDYSDLTSPTNNQIPDIHIDVSFVYATLYCLILHFNEIGCTSPLIETNFLLQIGVMTTVPLCTFIYT